METFKNCNFVSIVVTVSITTLLLIIVYPRNYDKLPNIDNMILDNLEKIHKGLKNHAKSDQEKMKLLQQLMSMMKSNNENTQSELRENTKKVRIISILRIKFLEIIHCFRNQRKRKL